MTGFCWLIVYINTGQWATFLTFLSLQVGLWGAYPHQTDFHSVLCIHLSTYKKICWPPSPRPPPTVLSGSTVVWPNMIIFVGQNSQHNEITVTQDCWVLMPGHSKTKPARQLVLPSPSPFAISSWIRYILRNCWIVLFYLTYWNM